MHYLQASTYTQNLNPMIGLAAMGICRNRVYRSEVGKSIDNIV
jgi:hypothetical protein